MTFRLLLLLLTFLAGVMFAQPSLFGPVSSHLRAGDFAPAIVFTRVLNAGSTSPWTPESLSGQVTVLAFFPDTSHNLQSVPRWNALVDKYRTQPIQFAWITGEEESSLLPWLQEHPIKGWVFHDPDGATGRAYGMEDAAAVIIGNDRRILGFDPSMLPEEETVKAALEGRITTTRPESSLAAIQAFAKSGRVLLNSESTRMPRYQDRKPNFPPSYTVHISPAKQPTSGEADSGDFAGDTDRDFQGFALRLLLAQIYAINPIRIYLPPALDNNQRYDIAVNLPQPESTESVNARILQAIQEHFGVIASREERLLDVYVVTAANGKPPAPLARTDDDLGSSGSSFSNVQFQHPKDMTDPEDFMNARRPISDIRGVALEGTLDDFCHTLESALDRPVINETAMQGVYEFNLKTTEGSENGFLDRLRNQFNLSIAPAQRRVQVVVLKPR
jgi:uncharacterized protein (TIGR03435 family)